MLSVPRPKCSMLTSAENKGRVPELAAADREITKIDELLELWYSAFEQIRLQIQCVQMNKLFCDAQVAADFVVCQYQGLQIRQCDKAAWQRAAETIVKEIDVNDLQRSVDDSTAHT